MQDQGPDRNRPIGRRGFLEAGAGAWPSPRQWERGRPPPRKTPPRRPDQRCCPGAGWAEPASM